MAINFFSTIDIGVSLKINGVSEMQIPSSLRNFGTNLKTKVTNMGTTIKEHANTAGKKIGEGFSTAGTKLSELSKDTVDFVKTNPKATAAAVGVGAGVVLLYNGIKKAIENKRVQNFQKELFNKMIDSQNDQQKALLRNIIKKQDAALRASHDTIEDLKSKIND